MQTSTIDLSRRRWLGAIPALSGALLLAPGFARAQGSAYPHRPIELVVPWQAGGGADVVTLDDRGERGEDVVADVLPRGVHGHLDGGPDVGLEVAVAE